MCKKGHTLPLLLSTPISLLVLFVNKFCAAAGTKNNSYDNKLCVEKSAYILPIQALVAEIWEVSWNNLVPMCNKDPYEIMKVEDCQ